MQRVRGRRNAKPLLRHRKIDDTEYRNASFCTSNDLDQRLSGRSIEPTGSSPGVLAEWQA
jgi:hypothetical protein